LTKREVEELRRSTRVLEEEKVRLVEENGVLEEETTKLKNDNTILAKDNDRLVADVEEIRRQKDELVEHKQNMLEENAELIKERGILVAEKTKLIKVEVKLATSEKENGELRRRLEDTMDKNAKIKYEVEDMREEEYTEKPDGEAKKEVKEDVGEKMELEKDLEMKEEVMMTGEICGVKGEYMEIKEEVELKEENMKNDWEVMMPGGNIGAKGECNEDVEIKAEYTEISKKVELKEEELNTAATHDEINTTPMTNQENKQRFLDLDKLASVRCMACEELMPAGSEFDKHIMTPHSLHCSDCKLVFINEAKLQKHTCKKHSKSTEADLDLDRRPRAKVSRRRSGDGKVGEYWLCAECGGPEETAEHLATHLRKAHQQRCQEEGCEMRFITKAELFKHQRAHLAEHAFKGVYLCHTCDEVVENKSRASHNRAQHDMPFGAAGCDAQLTTRKMWWTHKILRHAEGTCTNQLQTKSGKISIL